MIVGGCTCVRARECVVGWWVQASVLQALEVEVGSRSKRVQGHVSEYVRSWFMCMIKDACHSFSALSLSAVSVAVSPAPPT